MATALLGDIGASRARVCATTGRGAAGVGASAGLVWVFPSDINTIAVSVAPRGCNWAAGAMAQLRTAAGAVGECEGRAIGGLLAGAGASPGARIGAGVRRPSA